MTDEAANATTPDTSGAAAEQASSVQQPARERTRLLVKVAAVVLLLGVCSAAVWYWVIRGPEPKDDLERFQGDWKMTIGSGSESRNDLPPRAVRIVGDRWQFLANGKEIEGKTFRLTLDEAADPREIELTLIDAAGNPLGAYRSHGVYTIDRKTARVLVDPANRPRPRNLNDPDAVVWVLEKVKFE